MKNLWLMSLYLILVYLAWFAAQQSPQETSQAGTPSERNSFEYPTFD